MLTIGLFFVKKNKLIKKFIMNKKLKIGFIVDSYHLKSFTYELIKHVNDLSLFEKPILITGHQKYKNEQTIKLNFKYLLHSINLFFINLLIRLIHKYELGNAIKKFPNYRKKYDITKLKLKCIKVKARWSASNLILNFDEKSVSEIKKNNFDLIYFSGSGIIRGEILNSTKIGVISLHHADNRFMRGKHSGFWEVLKNKPTTGFIIQKLNNNLDAGEIILRGNIRTANYWLTNNARILHKSLIFTKNVFNNFALSKQIDLKKYDQSYTKKILKIDNPFILIAYIYKIYFLNFVNRIYYKILGKKNRLRWFVSFKKTKIEDHDFSSYLKIKNPKDRYLADPFVIEHQGKNICFVEDYCFKKQKAHISAIHLTSDNYNFLGKVIEEDFHLSYPFLIKHNGNIYMVPETNQSNQIRLYKSVDFPTRWKLEKILIENISASDTNIFYVSNTWFMLTNVCSSKMNDHNSELHIFYSKNLLSNSWQEIKSKNPVIFDSNIARNGGYFIKNDTIFRINQIHSKKYYGNKFAINKIIKLNTDEFKEKLITTISPDIKNGNVGSHHFNSNGIFNVIDNAYID